jgi:large subunit ribosomal protein L20
MPRSVNAVASRARRKKVLKQTKGNFGSRRNVITVAKNTLDKGLGYAYRDRKKKKGLFRALWIQRINAGVRQYDMSYSEFIGKVAKKGITLNRKTLADLAMNHPEAFKAIVDIKKADPGKVSFFCFIRSISLS